MSISEPLRSTLLSVKAMNSPRYAPAGLLVEYRVWRVMLDSEVLPSLPHTRSGNIMRRLLKARELGLPGGDISTLEQAT